MFLSILLMDGHFEYSGALTDVTPFLNFEKVRCLSSANFSSLKVRFHNLLGSVSTRIIVFPGLMQNLVNMCSFLIC